MNKLQKLLLIITIAILTSFFLIKGYGNKLNKTIHKFIATESKRIILHIVNDSVSEILTNNKINNLFIVEKNEKNEVEILDYNTEEVNKIIKMINQTITTKLQNLDNKELQKLNIPENLVFKNQPKIKNGIICEISIGSLKNNALYSNFGPSIPLKMSFQENTLTKIKTKYTSYGFNSLVIEIFVIVEVRQRISSPISAKETKIFIESPLTIKIIQGTIP